MTFDEKVFLGIAVAALAAIVLFRKRDAPVIDDETLRPTSIVGLSLTPETADMNSGPMYLTANERYAFWPPLNNFLPTVTSGQIGQVVQRPLDFVRAVFSKQEG